MRKAEYVGSIFFIMLGGCIIWQALSMDYYTSIGPGPGFFPLWLGIILTVLSGSWVVSLIQASAPAVGDHFFPEWRGLRQIMFVIGATVCVGIAMEWIGFQLAMFAFTVFVLVVLGKHRWYLTAILASVLSFGVYHVFTRWLDVNLPPASIEILKALGL